MAIAEKEIKILWGKAAGICARPTCQMDLVKLVENGDAYQLGEMAHVIGRKPTAARSNGTYGPDTYKNLILLCPTCHTEVDKVPEIFTEALLFEWKKSHEESIETALTLKTFEDASDLIAEISYLLSENRSGFDEYGPNSTVAKSVPNSNAHALWEAFRLRTIVPNNRKIVNFIEGNRRLLRPNQFAEFVKFKLHADAYEQHVFTPREHYPLFPTSFPKSLGI